MTPRNFNAAELDEMQVDWQRTHNVKIVAELHGCTQPEVVQALGLDPAKYAKSGGRTWEKKHPDEAAAFCALVDGGMSIRAATAKFQLSQSAGWNVYKRMKEGLTAMNNKETAPEPIAPADYTVPAKSGNEAQNVYAAIERMSYLVDLMNRQKLLSESELNTCEHVMAMADAFRAGIEYSEAHNDK